MYGKKLPLQLKVGLSYKKHETTIEEMSDGYSGLRDPRSEFTFLDAAVIEW